MNRDDDDVQFWALVRQALLLLVDAVERFKLHKKPRTAELRKMRGNERD